MAQHAFQHGSSTVEGFFGWINERHQIYLNRENGNKKPWTKDPIMQEYKFTNAFRELDTGTVSLRCMEQETWEKLQAEQDPEGNFILCKQIVFNTFWYRTFNWWEHARDLGMVTHYDEIHDYFMKLHKEGRRIFTGAHMVRGDGPVKLFPYLKLLKTVWEDLDRLTGTILIEDTMQHAFNECMHYYLVGKFNAYELVCDWRFSLDLGASDRCTWGSIGPGAARGLQRLGYPGKRVEEMVDLWRRAPLYLAPHVIGHFPEKFVMSKELGASKVVLLGKPVEKVEWPPFEIREIEHSLCEFDKWSRAKAGEGRPRQKFQGI